MTAERLHLPTTLATFSVYNLLNPASVMNIFTEKPHILAFWSHRIERAVVDYQLQADVYVGFQKLSRFYPVMRQYEQIARQARRVWVFSEPDVPYPNMGDKVQFVDLQSDDALSREWFVVVQTPIYARALVAREVTAPDVPQNKRLFEGVLTSDVPIIEAMDSQLLQLTSSLR